MRAWLEFALGFLACIALQILWAVVSIVRFALRLRRRP